MLKSICFIELSLQEIKNIIGEESDKIFQIYPYEAINYIMQFTVKYHEYEKDFIIKFIDCRIIKTKFLPMSVSLSKKSLEDKLELDKIIQKLCDTDKDTHLCLFCTNDFDNEEKEFMRFIYMILMKNHKNHVSILFGGFEVSFL